MRTLLLHAFAEWVEGRKRVPLEDFYRWRRQEARYRDHPGQDALWEGGPFLYHARARNLPGRIEDGDGL